MSNQQNPQDEFGGFGESDEQTFLHDKSKLFSASESTSSSSNKTESKETGSGFISYVQPDIPPEDEQSSVKKMAVIAIATISVFIIIWLLIPSNDGEKTNPEQNDTIAEKTVEEEQKQAQATTVEQDSIARVQDYLARMQMSQGQSIGNNEQGNDVSNAETEAPEKKVIPPDPIPAKNFPEYREVENSELSESIQKDQPVQQKNRAQKTISENKKKQEKNIAKKSVKDIANKKIAEKPSNRKQSQQDQVLSETFVDKEPINKNQEIKKEVKSTSGEEYSVQVLSSISKQEADRALKTLKSKGISSALISKKSLNGKTWYRVRFGSFENRNQAQSAAKKAGYSHSWIDRVK